MIANLFIWLLLRSQMLLIFIALPYLSLLISRYLRRKHRRWVFAGLVLMILPILIGFDYRGRPVEFYVVLFFLLACILCSFQFDPKSSLKANRIKVISLTTSAAVIFSLFFLLGKFAGFEKIPNIWVDGHDIVEYRYERGFAGPALQTYVWYQKSKIPWLMNEIEASTDYDTTNTCLIIYQTNNRLFDRCDGNWIK